MKHKTLPSIPLKALFTIVDYNFGKKVIELYQEQNLPIHLFTHGHGLASSEILDYLGIGEVKKSVLLSILPEKSIPTIYSMLTLDLEFDKPGTGIAFTIPVSSMNSFIAALCVQTNHHYLKESEERNIMQGYSYELIFTIVTKDYSSQVMSAAKSAGATGGTLIHARGLGSEEAEKFLGITIQPEKEIILILAPRNKKQEIMQTITKEVGLSTLGKGICFSLPVDSALGLGEQF